MTATIDRVRGLIGRSRYPLLAAGALGGLLGGLVSALSLVLAVPFGLSLSVGLGVALTWLGVLLGTVSAIAFVAFTAGYALLLGYHRLKRL